MRAAQKIGKGSEKYAMTHKGIAITSFEPRGAMSDAIALAVVPCGELHGGRGSPERIAYDSLTACTFHREPVRSVFGTFANWAIDMLNAAAGWDLKAEDWDHLVRRIVIMERCYSIREGYVPTRDDTLPDRFFDEVIHTKYGKPRILDRNEFLGVRKKWYQIIGVNEDGIPKKEDLKKLGLEFVIPNLEKT